MKIIALSNQKGGTTKSTTTYNLAAIKALEGKRVLMTDLDPQGSLTISCSMARDFQDKDISGVLKGADPLDCAYTVESLDMDNLYIIPADIHLAETEVELFAMTAREKKLKRGLEKLSDYFDYCFIDCPPQLSILSTNGLVAANEVIIPCKTDYLAYMGLKALITTIKGIQNDPDMNPRLKIDGIIATIYEKQVKDQQDIWDLLHEFEVPFLGTIRKSADASRAVYKGLPVVVSQPKSKVAQDYYDIAKQI